MTLLDKDELNRQILPMLELQILSCSKDPKTDLEESDVLKFNENFVHKSYKIKIPIKKGHKKEEPVDSNVEGLYIERKFLIDATIIRIMKSRKRMQISQLSEEVIKISSPNYFVPNIKMIKSSIESLINRDYLQRDNDKKIIEYIS